jgi:hypothetical protein
MSQLVIEGRANHRKLPFWGPPNANETHLRVFPYSLSWQFYLQGKIAEGVVLIQPLLITVELDEDGYFIMSDDLFLVYGEGRTEAEAKEDYAASLIDYFQLASRAPE